MTKKLNRLAPKGVFSFQLALWGIYTPLNSYLHSIYRIYSYALLGSIIFLIKEINK